MNDRWVVRAVVVFLGISTLLCLGIAGWLAADEKELPDFITTAGGAVIGALGALLTSVRSRSGDDGPTPVEVTNSMNDPVPTTEFGA